MDVTDVLRDRMVEPAGLSRMAVASITVHALAVIALVVSPGHLFGTHEMAPPREVMTITLGGGNGPANGGMTAMGGRPVQAVTPPEVTRPEPVTAPAARTPEMTMPVPNAARPRPAPTRVVTSAPDEAHGRTPTHGAQTTPGSALANTGTQGRGFGLSTGGGPGAGATLDVADFCCPDYLVLMTERIKTAWDQKQGVAGQAVVRFTIQRDGRLTDAEVERASGTATLDLAALRAVLVTRQLTPLPAAFPNPSLTVHLSFEFQR